MIPLLGENFIVSPQSAHISNVEVKYITNNIRTAISNRKGPGEQGPKQTSGTTRYTANPSALGRASDIAGMNVTSIRPNTITR